MKEILLVLFMQVLSLLLEYVNTGTLSPSVKKRLVVESIVLVVYIGGMTVFKGMISNELLTLIGTVYIATVCRTLFVFLNDKNKEAKDNKDK